MLVYATEITKYHADGRKRCVAILCDQTAYITERATIHH
jgi:hypothetical protein